MQYNNVVAEAELMTGPPAKNGYSREKPVTYTKPIINSQIREVIPVIQSHSLKKSVLKEAEYVTN